MAIIDLIQSRRSIRTYKGDPVPEFSPEDVKQLLNMPDPLKVLYILPIGYPNQQKEPPVRRSLDEFVHWECFDKSKMRSNELIEEAHKDPYGVQVKNY